MIEGKEYTVKSVIELAGQHHPAFGPKLRLTFTDGSHYEDWAEFFLPAFGPGVFESKLLPATFWGITVRYEYGSLVRA